MSSYTASTCSACPLPLTNPTPTPAPALQHTTSRQGRLYSWSSEKLEVVSAGIKKIAYAILFPLNLIFANTAVVSTVFKNLGLLVVPMVEQVKGLPNHFAKLKSVLVANFNIINTVQIFQDADYFINGKYKNQSMIGVSANAFGSVAHALTSAAWISQLGLISSLSIGNSRIFGQTINGTLALANALCTIDTSSKIPSAKNEVLKKSLMIELAKNLGNLTLSVMILAGRSSVINLGIMGAACIGLEILNLIYKKQHEHAIL